ncbi:MAG: hypothetical protein A3E01_18570 [Gammaproteobacteria bacterium RIFCSPHIGHO2_12_FULL_63_22]|nr:MAG: hypothetical protein A3E01_18570 [Gammaproteobacteria bacterium RIFCSPHIGHO2_12_FULL_63_22]
MEDKLIKSAWNSYLARVIPADAPIVQVTESRRAFYAGAQALLGTLMARLDPDKEPTEADLVMMDSIKAELDQFARDVQAGKA